MDNHVIGYLIAAGIISFGVIYHSVAWHQKRTQSAAAKPSGQRK